ncbi:MAG: proline hydroxylase [Euryarchaeota archaeon]|nr:proline hydroxylase [Euryarchaeota archaeon]
MKIITDQFNTEFLKKNTEVFLNNKPYPHIIIDNFLNEDIANNVLMSFELNDNWTNCSLINNYKKYQLTNRNYMNESCNKIFDELGSSEFVKKVSELTGLRNIFLDTTLDGGGLHQIFNNGSLNVHTDFNSHTKNKTWRRVLNILIYLNKDWKTEYNGNLELWDKDVKNKIRSIEPIFNRCVIFKTDKLSFHGHPEKLNLPKNLSRKSLAAYYFIDEKKNLQLYSTNFVGRPKDTLFYKFLIWTDTFLNKIFSFLKRYKIVDDKFASKILNLLK